MSIIYVPLYVAEVVGWLVLTYFCLHDKDVPRMLRRVLGVQIPMLIALLALTTFFQLKQSQFGGTWTEFILVLGLAAFFVMWSKLSIEVNETLKRKIDLFKSRRG